MPEKRDRKRKTRDRRIRDDAASPGVPAIAAPLHAQVAPAVPSNTARATGFAIAVITVFLAVLTFADAFTGDRATADAVIRAVVGAFLVLLGIVVGLLSLFPAQVRRMVRGA